MEEVEKSGFTKKHIIDSLNNDELNYATTFYYLLTIEKEYWEIKQHTKDNLDAINISHSGEFLIICRLITINNMFLL